MQEESRFDSLGRLEDLPQEYRDRLSRENLVPLWPSLRAMLPPNVPSRLTRATHWTYPVLRELLLEAGTLTPIEKAERRVLVLANPGHGIEKMQASPAIYLGMQLLLPGERAPAHRHTPNAVRMVVEGDGAWTLAGGEKCTMNRGDLILTPSGVWHEHGHDGADPVIWLDVLDLPLIYYTETSYHVEGPSQKVTRPQGAKSYARGGIRPTPLFKNSDQPYPMLCYPWSDTKAALYSLAEVSNDDYPVQVTYCNPETGQHAQNILGFYAMMLKPGQSIDLPARSPAQVFHQIEGSVEMQVESQKFSLMEADTAVSPGYSGVALRNLSDSKPAFIFIADESPLHQKLGVYESR